MGHFYQVSTEILPFMLKIGFGALSLPIVSSFFYFELKSIYSDFSFAPFIKCKITLNYAIFILTLSA